MPELPEVETVRLGLQRLIKDKVIMSEKHNWPKSFPNSESDVMKYLIGSKVLEVKRRAKVLIIELDTEYTLVIHLKMTGQLVFKSEYEKFGAGHPTESLVNDLPDKSTRVEIGFQDGGKLYFNDQRKFGWMRLIPTAEVPMLNFFQKVGPEPLASDFTLDVFKSRLKRRSNSNIKSVLLDQTILAGIGNIYADESLWAARIHPETQVNKLTAYKLGELYRAIKKVLKLSIAKGGSTDRNYVDAEGKRGSYLSFANVFRRDGKPCIRCGTKIIKIRVAGRGTHICPHCQRKK